MKKAKNAVVFRARSLIAGLLACCWLLATKGYGAEQDFPVDADFNILSADGARVIGHTHYSVKPEGTGRELIHGESHYLSGEYDIERNQVQTRGPDELAVLEAYEHAFFNADGSLARMSKANFRSGDALCATYEKADIQEYRATLSFPSDTYAGAALVIPLQHHLNESSKGPVVVHDFNCIPEPKVLNVEVYPKSFAPWLSYHGNLLEMEITPDFGWLNFMVAPFVPKMHAWFDPSGAWQFIGGEFTRYYKGPQIILARVPTPASVGPGPMPREAHPAQPAAESEPIRAPQARPSP
jgi:hypothetical protein